MVAYLPRNAVRVLVIFLSLVFFILPAYSEQSDLNYFADGVEAFDDGNYEEAVRAIKRAIEINPSNLEYGYYLGLAYTRLNRYDEALQIFNYLVEKDPENYFKAYFDISSIYTKQQNYMKALEILDSAEKADPQNARVYLEKGYAHKNLKNYDQAVNSLNRARAFDPGLTQVVTYDIAVIYFEKEEFDRSLQAFEKAVEIDPNTPIAENARLSIRSVKAAKRVRKPWYILGSFAWAYDDNVPLDPLEMVTPRPGPVTDEDDQFQTFLIKGGYKLINRKDVELGAGYSLYCIGYKEWVQSNVMAHTPHLYFQYVQDPVIFRLQYEFGYYYAGGNSDTQDDGFYLTFGDGSEDKLRMHSIMPVITILEPYNLKSELVFNYQNKHYLDDLTPHATHYSAGIIQSYKFPQAECYPRIGYKYGEEDADDDDYSYDYHEVQAGITAALFWGVVGDASLTHIRTEYQARRDKTYITAVSLNRFFYDIIQAQLYYSHTRNRSNWEGGNDPHKFKKNVYLCSLTVMF